MSSETLRLHWDKVYSTKKNAEMSWFQQRPGTSLSFIAGFRLPKNARIVDVGGGDSFLVDHLLAEGYTDITVVDISEKALERAKERLGKSAARVKWVAADICTWKPEQAFDLWHDRAVFHFMTTEEQVQSYLRIASSHLHKNSHMIIGTFSENGPDKCSGLHVQQYSRESLEQLLAPKFDKLKCLNEEHHTPFNTTQHFLFCSFRRKAA